MGMDVDTIANLHDVDASPRDRLSAPGTAAWLREWNGARERRRNEAPGGALKSA
jgi:hypothetical protein